MKHQAGVPNNNGSNLEMGIAFHKAGRLAEAAAIYASLLKSDPDNVHALRLAGLVLIQSGDARAGLSQISRAAALAPNLPEVQSNLGTALVGVGDYARAAKAFRNAVRLKPGNVDELNNLAAAYLKLSRPNDALEVLREASEAAPENPVTQKNLGNAWFEMGEYETAANAFAEAIRLAPGLVDAYYNLGTCFLHLGKAQDAIAVFVRAAELAPKRADIQYNLAAAYKRLDDKRAALAAYQNCLAADPQFVRAWVDYARCLDQAGYGEDALEALRHATQLAPDDMDALDNLGQAASRAGLFTEALATIRHSIALQPNRAESHNNLGVVTQMTGDVGGAMNAFRRALDLDPDKQFAEKNLLFAALNDAELSTKDLYELHLEMSKRHERYNGAVSFAERNRNPERRLRIGYLSSDFHDHPVGRNILPLLANHNSDAMEVFLYAHVEKRDQYTYEFEGLADHWCDVTELSDGDAADLIRKDEIDVLVTTAGRFNQNRRFVACHRAAPIQVSFHDCATTGLGENDYWLTDAYLHPEQNTERFTESLLHLPVFYQFPDPGDLPETANPPSGERGFVTFGSFSKPEKINDRVVSLWADILRAVPNSRLRLKYHSFFREDAFRDAWRRRFEEHGIEADRLDLEPEAAPRAHHLQSYNEIDVALDPFPFNGATTTFEALAMGVPVVTLEGNSFVSRAAGSILTHAGLDDLVAADPDAYVGLAAGLAADPERLAEIRHSLRAKLAHSPLCNGGRYARSMEAAYRRIWTNWCSVSSTT